MSKSEINPKQEMPNTRPLELRDGSDSVIPSNFGPRTSSLSDALIQTADRLTAILPALTGVPRVAVDTEADSLHCYREKLCLLQISVPDHDFLVDPLAGLDLSSLASALQSREIVLHGADFD